MRAIDECDYQHFLRFVETCYQPTSRPHHVVAHLKPLLQHSSFSCGTVDVGTGAISVHVNRDGFARTAPAARHADNSPPASNVRRWLQDLKPIVISPTGDGATQTSPQSPCTAIHGILNKGDWSANWFAFSGVDPERRTRVASLLRMTVPHLNAALSHLLADGGGRQRQTTALSARERVVLQWLSQGRTAGEIADILVVSICTVRTHIRNILQKLNAANIPHAIMLGVTHGLIVSPPRPTVPGPLPTSRRAAAAEAC